MHVSAKRFPNHLIHPTKINKIAAWSKFLLISRPTDLNFWISGPHVTLSTWMVKEYKTTSSRARVRQIWSKFLCDQIYWMNYIAAWFEILNNGFTKNDWMICIAAWFEILYNGSILIADRPKKRIFMKKSPFPLTIVTECSLYPRFFILTEKYISSKKTTFTFQIRSKKQYNLTECRIPTFHRLVQT